MPKVILRKGDPDITEFQFAAINAMHRGDASPEQQRAGMDWIIRAACRLGQTVCEDLPHKQYFHEGKRDVGRLIRDVIENPIDVVVTIREKGPRK